MLGREEIAGRDDFTQPKGAEPALNEAVQPAQVQEQLGGRVRDQLVVAVPRISATGVVDVAKERGDDKQLPIPADRQDPFQVGDGRRHGDFVCDDASTHYVELVVDKFDNLSNNSVTVCLTEGRIVQTVDNHWCLSRQSEAVGLNLRKGSGDRSCVENPATLGDRVRDDSDVGGRVGQPVRVAAADVQGGITPEVLGRLGERVSSRERTGSESSSSLNFELSSVRRV